MISDIVTHRCKRYSAISSSHGGILHSSHSKTSSSRLFDEVRLPEDEVRLPGDEVRLPGDEVRLPGEEAVPERKLAQRMKRMTH